MPSLPIPLPTVGFIGTGEMGGPMARSLLHAEVPVVAFDIDADRLSAVVSAGASPGQSVAEVVTRSDIVATSLPSSSAFVHVAETEILPSVRPARRGNHGGLPFVTTISPRVSRYDPPESAVAIRAPPHGHPAYHESEERHDHATT